MPTNSTAPALEKLTEYRVQLPDGCKLTYKEAPFNARSSAMLSLFITSESPLFNEAVALTTMTPPPIELFTSLWTRSSILEATSQGRRTSLLLQRRLHRPQTPHTVNRLLKRIAHAFDDSLQSGNLTKGDNDE